MKVVVIGVLLLIGCVCGSLEAPQKRVMIDVFHSLENVNPEVNMVAVSKWLTDFSFESSDEMLTEDLLKEYDAVMLYQPYGILEESEIAAVIQFVERGGGLIICGEHDVGWNDDSRSTYNKLGKTFGIIFTSNAVDDPTDKMGCYCTPIVHNMAEHPLTEGIAQLVFYKPCSLRISSDAVAIARGDDDTVTIGADRIEGEDIVVVAASEYGRGRVVVVGSHTVFDDSYINHPDNLTFCGNVFPWVSEPGYAVPEDEDNTSWYPLAAILVIVSILVLVTAVWKWKQRKGNEAEAE